MSGQEKTPNQRVGLFGAADIDEELDALVRSIDRSRKRNLSGDLLRGDQAADRLRQQEVSASPLLKKKREMALTLADFNSILDSKVSKRLDALDEGNRVLRGDVSKVNENVKLNAAKIDKHDQAIKSNQDSIRTIRQELQAIREERTAFPPLAAPSTSTTGNCAADDDTYMKARRSLRLWPCEGVTTELMWRAVGQFLDKNLGLSTITESMIEAIARPAIPSGPGVREEVIVCFIDVATRDLVMGSSARLAPFTNAVGRPTAGIRLEVPPGLRVAFTVLFKFGQLLRARHGPGTRRHVKFDDVDKTLFLNAKLPGEESWSRVSLDVAKRGLRARELLNDNDLERRLDTSGPISTVRPRPASTSTAGPPPVPSTSAAAAWTGRRHESISID